MAKAHCPGCGAGMKAKHRFCGECGRRNPLFPPKDGQAVKAARPVLVKSAPPATVTEIRRGAAAPRDLRRSGSGAARGVHPPAGGLCMKGSADVRCDSDAMTAEGHRR